MVGKTHKICRRCNELKPKSEFVGTDGKPNLRLWYCEPCGVEIARENAEAYMEGQQANLRKLHIIFGRYWDQFAFPGDLSGLLYAERSHCPYCSKPLPPEYLGSNDSAGPCRGMAHLDHMDPLERGGEDNIRNVLYVCDVCNVRKKDSRFLDWIEKLSPECKALSYYLYTQKHGHLPEEFEEGPPTPRVTGSNYELHLTEAELLELYPTPIDADIDEMMSMTGRNTGHEH